MEKEAERCRAELGACLEKASSADRLVFEAAETASAIEMLTLEKSTQEVSERTVHRVMWTIFVDVDDGLIRE